MSNRTNSLIVAVAVAAGLAGFVAGQVWLNPRHPAPSPARTQSGDSADEIGTRLIGLDGRAHTLADFKGRARLVNVWATWCGPCRDEMPLLDALHQHNGADKLMVLGVADDDAGAVQRYLAGQPVAYPILVDASGTGELARELGNDRSVIPYTVLIDAQGKVLASHLGRFDTAADLAEFVAPVM